MRVLLWTEQYWPYLGGLEVLTTRFAAAMRQRGHDVHVVTSHGHLELPDEDEHEGVPVHRFRFFEAVSSRNVELLVQMRQRLVRLKKSVQPDLVHVCTVSPSVFFHVQTAAVMPSAVLVTQQLATLPGQRTGHDTVLGQVLESADWVTCCSRALLDEMRSIAPRITDRSSVVYNGVEAPPLAPAPLPGAPVLLCLGRLVLEKGFDVALDALPAIRKRFPAARLVIAGDGPSRPDLEQRARSLRIDDAVTFAGWTAPEQVPELINTTSVVLVPSRAEAFGLVAVEAALMSRPVVATRVGGLPEVVEDGRTGVLVDPDRPEQLAEAATTLLADPSGSRAMGAAGRARALEQFTWDAHLDAYEEIYLRCLTARASAQPADPTRSRAS